MQKPRAVQHDRNGNCPAISSAFGRREADSRAAVARYAAEAHKFSLVESGVLEKPACKLLVTNGMEDSIFPVEDSIVVSIQGRNKHLVLRADRRHMGNPGAEEIVYGWFDSALSGKA